MSSTTTMEGQIRPERNNVEDLEIKPMAPASLEAVQHSFNGLNDFSRLLSTALGSMDANHNALAASYASTVSLVNSLKSQIAKQNETIKHLEEESKEQRSKVENAVLSVTSLGKNVDDQLSESVKVMHKELVVTRTAAKMDMNQLRGKITSSMSEALTLIQEPRYKNVPQYDPNSSTKESIDFLVEKVKSLEESNTLQHSVNTALSNSIAEGSGAMIQHIYDSLYEQIASLDTALNASKAENDKMREKYESNFHDLQDFCENQTRQIEDLTLAVVNKNKMKRFKLELSRAKEETGSYLPENHLTYKAEDSSETNEDGTISEAKAGHRRTTMKRSSTSASSNARKGSHLPKTTEDSDEDAEGEEPGELPDLPGNEHLQERRRASQQSKRRHTSRKSQLSAGPKSEEAFDNIQYGGSQRGSVSSHHSHSHHGHHKHGRPSMAHSTTPQETPATAAAAVTTSSSEGGVSTASETPASTETAARPTSAKRSTVVQPAAGAAAPTTPTKSNAANRATIMASSPIAYRDPVTGKMSRPGSSHGASPLPEGTILEGEEEEEEVPVKDTKAAPSATVTAPTTTGREEDEQEWDSEEGEYDEYSDYSEYSDIDNDSAEHLNKVIAEMKKDYEARIVELETTIFGLKRMTYVMDDLKINYDNMKNKFDEVLSVKDDSIIRKLDAAKFASLEDLKHKWHKVLVEMMFGLDNLADEQSAISEGELSSLQNQQENRLFFKKAAELVTFLEETMDDFEPRENINITLVKLHPGLDKIYKQALQLIKMDRSARHSDTLDFCFDDILCSDLTPNLKRFVEEAAAATVNVLDETIAKIGLQMRLDHLEHLIETKADGILTANATADIRHLLKNKVDQKEFSAVTGKLASLSDLNTLRKSMNDMAPSLNGMKGVAANVDSSGHSVSTVEADVAHNADFIDMKSRFEMLTKQCGDLKEYCDKYVPREEVHEAMKAVIGEVKLIKKNYVPSNVFKEGLKMKADMEEVEKLIRTLNEAIGELNLNHTLLQQKKSEINNGPQAYGESAVIHQKCLICDKPVSNVQRAKTAGKNMRGTALELSKSTTQLGYDKDMDLPTKLPRSSSSQLNRLTSANLEISNNERAKVVTELAIVRSSIDPLPEITDSITEMSPRGSGANAVNNSQYKQRIRASAGGGVGPSYKMDTR